MWLGPSNNGKEEPGECLRGSLRVRARGVRTIPRKPDRTLFSRRPQTEVGTTFRDALCSAHLCPSPATHLLAHLMICNTCKLPEAATLRGKQKGLSVEGGKPGFGWGPPVPRGPAQLSTTWRGRCHTQLPVLSQTLKAPVAPWDLQEPCRSQCICQGLSRIRNTLVKSDFTEIVNGDY